MMNLLKISGVTAVLTTLMAALVACTTTSPPTSFASQPTNEPTPEPERPSLNLPDQGEAPEIRNEVWINTEEPVTLAASRGKVVLLEFWTFG